MSQPDLPLEPEHQRDDVVPGPRVPARYGSYATSIRRSTRQWRILEQGDPLTWSGRWRSVDDYTDADCMVGKWGRTDFGEGAIRYWDEDQDYVLSIDGVPYLEKEVAVVEDDVHFNAFQRTMRLYDTAGRHAGGVAAVLTEAREYREEQKRRIRSTGGTLRASLLKEFGWTEADLERE